MLSALVAGCGSDAGPELDSPRSDPGDWDRDYPRNRTEALLTRTPFPRLVVEIDYVEGYAPSASAVNTLMQTLENVSDKDEIVLLDFQQMPASDPFFAGEPVWTSDSVFPLREKYASAAPASRTQFGIGVNATLHILYVNGRTASDSGAESYGLQADNALVVVASRIRDGSPTENGDIPPVPNLAADRVERAVLVHMLGHALGLVNNGAPMTKARASEDGHHSTNPRSVMSLGIRDTYAALDPFTGEDSTPYQFDEDDLADLAAVHARARGD